MGVLSIKLRSEFTMIIHCDLKKSTEHSSHLNLWKLGGRLYHKSKLGDTVRGEIMEAIKPSVKKYLL